MAYEKEKNREQKGNQSMRIGTNFDRSCDSPSMIIKEYKQKLKELDDLHLPKGEYAITGGGPLAAVGLRRADDIDVVVKTKLWNRLIVTYPPYDEHHIKIGNVEIWGDFINLTPIMDQVIDRAEEKFGYPFVTLVDTLAWKVHLNRPKDREDMLLINEYLEMTPEL